jgi:hypothetical protein
MTRLNEDYQRQLPGSVPFHLLVVATLAIEGPLDGRLESDLILVVEADEFEGLKTP